MDLNKKFFLFGWVLIFCTVCGHSQVDFPLVLSENGRFLEDQSKHPFLIKEFSAWGLIQALPEEEAVAFLDSIAEKGFNTILTSIVSNATSQMGGNPPYWQGISPFQVQWDFSTPNESYFQHADRILEMARSKGFLVLLVPCYLGYPGDGSQGWWDEVRGINNSPEKMHTYGEFLGERYSEVPNIIWVAGGDNDASDQDYPYMDGLIKGIKSRAPKHYWTGHFNNSTHTFWSTDNPLYRDYIDLDGFYVWSEITLDNGRPQYMSEVNQYNKGKMIFQIDQSYEHDVPHYADNENPQWIRRKRYNGLLSGCAGTSFSSGTLTNQCYWFKDWKPLMSTLGMKQSSFCFNLFESLPWQSFVPDTSSQIIVEGRGEWGTRDFICAAGDSDGRYYVMYIPGGRSIWLNMKEMSEHTMRLHWYNPRSGISIKIGHVGGSERFGLIPPDEKDWLLICDADEEFSVPGLVR